MAIGNLDAFMSSTSPDRAGGASHSGNTSEAVQLAAELRQVARSAAERAPRQVQVHLGPSELGTSCDRQVVHKLLQLPTTNHVSDGWPSIVGTAVHAWLADAFTADNPERWIAERRVVPHPDHSGTADLYDAKRRAVIDHKILGSTTHTKIRQHGPGRTYTVQLLLYALGYMLEGYPVDAVALAAWPRTKSSMADLYVWWHPIEPDDYALLSEVLDDTQRRKDLAALVQMGALPMDSVPRAPDDSDCYFCPAYRPQAAHDGGSGCPGPRKGPTP